MFFVHHPLHREERFFVVTPKQKAANLCCHTVLDLKLKETIGLLTGRSCYFLKKEKRGVLH